MKLVLKKLPDQVTIEVEVAEDATCDDLKRKIQTDHQFDVSWQKVIFAGRIVSDDARLDGQGIKDGSSLVLVVRKPDSAPASAPAAAAPQSAPAATTPAPATSPAADTPAAATPAVAAPAAAAAAATTQAPAFTPSDEALSALLGMGFEQEQSVRALRLARNDVQNACELLLSGAPLPEPTTPASAAAAAAAAASSAQQATDPQQEASALMTDLIQRMGQQSTDPHAQVEWVTQQPQFQRIRSLLRTRPDLFAGLLTQLGNSDPQLHELISQNQAEFLEWLNDEEGGDGDGGGVSVVQTGGGGGGGGGAQLSQRDETSITRLMELGFGRDAVRQAYLACGKNEEMAANYLFENS